MSEEQPKNPWPALGLVVCVVVFITLLACIWIGI